MIADIRLDQIERNPEQPREEFPPDHIAGLARSIKARGLIQAITLRKIGKDRYMIVAGECRFLAHKLLKRETIRAEIVAIDESEMQLRAIVENLQRRDMNPLEEARSFKLLLDRGYTLPQIVDELGIGRAHVDNRLKLLDLTGEIQKLVASGGLSPAMASAISWVPREQQTRIVQAISRGTLKTVEQVRHAAIALRDAADQSDAFGDAPRASAKDVAAVSHLENKIEAIAGMVQAGFKDGECIAAQRVSPDRVKTMADKLALIRKHVLQMEHDLRRVATQSEMLMETAA